MASTSEAPARPSAGLLCWALFEWARNPYVLVITIYIYATYFTRDIIGDPVRGQALWAAIQGYAGLGIAVLAPFLGAMADAGGRRKPWLAVFGILLALSTGSLWFGKPGGAGIGLAGVAAAVAISNIAYDGSLVFHGAMLPWLAPPRRIGRWSGLGYALGNVAGILLLIFVLTFFYLPAHPALGLDRASHEPERIAGPLCAVWFCLFAWPFFVWTPDRQPSELSFRENLRRGFASVARTFRSVRQYRNVAAYLGARMIYNDGLNVMLAFGGVYAAGVFHWGVTEFSRIRIGPVCLCRLGRVARRQSRGSHRYASRFAVIAFGDDCCRGDFARLYAGADVFCGFLAGGQARGKPSAVPDGPRARIYRNSYGDSDLSGRDLCKQPRDAGASCARGARHRILRTICIIG